MILDASETQSNDETSIKRLYHNLLQGWNKRNAADVAELFMDDGTIIGFDGSHIRGRDEIEKHLTSIFYDHATASYISKIRNIKWITSEVAILSAIAGMVPPRNTDINPDLNAVQVLMTYKENNHWKIAFFQNTPAAFHGHPEMTERFNKELREVLKEEFLSEVSAQGF
ncbi:MAG: SgcJ/EcaC family oxidoreductase [Pseudobdellovibrionaceae bacterium]